MPSKTDPPNVWYDWGGVPRWSLVFAVEVFGNPITQGSMRAFIPKGWSRPVVTHNNFSGLGAWRGQIGEAVRRVAPAPLISTPVAVALTFSFERPKSHYFNRKSGRVLRDDAPTFAEAGKDGDKLERAVWDALSGSAFVDDRQVVQWRGRKVFCGTPGALVSSGVRIVMSKLEDL